MAALAWLVLAYALFLLSANQRERLLDEARTTNTNIANAMEGNITDGLAAVEFIFANLDDVLQKKTTRPLAR